jgi:uncharacterized protein YneF (UPF0154 family)
MVSALIAIVVVYGLVSFFVGVIIGAFLREGRRR